MKEHEGKNTMIMKYERRIIMDYVEMLQNCLEQMGQEEMEARRENKLDNALTSFDEEMARYYARHPY